MYELRHYLTVAGKDVFEEWLDSVRDFPRKPRSWRESTVWNLAILVIPDRWAAAYLNSE